MLEALTNSFVEHKLLVNLINRFVEHKRGVVVRTSVGGHTNQGYRERSTTLGESFENKLMWKEAA